MALWPVETYIFTFLELEVHRDRSLSPELLWAAGPLTTVGGRDEVELVVGWLAPYCETQTVNFNREIPFS